MMKKLNRVHIAVMVLAGILCLLAGCAGQASAGRLKTVRHERIGEEDFFIKTGTYDGEYDVQTVLFNYDRGMDALEGFAREDCMTYEQYAAFCGKWGVPQTYSDPDRFYLIVSDAANSSPIYDAELIAKTDAKDGVDLYVWSLSQGTTADIAAFVLTIPVDQPAGQVRVHRVYTEEQFGYLKKFGVPFDMDNIAPDKPVIYLYPTESTEVSVVLPKKELLTCSYPAYTDGWNVVARPDGTLTDMATGRELYCLYYESRAAVPFGVEDVGFVVKGADTAEFLEEKLALLGLTEREAEEFIIYWLPHMERNPCNYIRFAEPEEIAENMPLEIAPAPDTVLRVLMLWKGLDAPISVREQELQPTVRTGFTVVEWGGAELP